MPKKRQEKESREKEKNMENENFPIIGKGDMSFSPSLL